MEDALRCGMSEWPEDGRCRVAVSALVNGKTPRTCGVYALFHDL